MRPFAAAVLASTSLLFAQESSRRQPSRALVDSVVATVNDGAILLSELRTLTHGTILVAEQRIGRKLRADEVQQLHLSELDKLMDKHRMGQAAKTFGILTPEQVEQYFREEMKRDEDEQMRTLGTQVYSTEMHRQGRIWQTYYREQRVEKMSQIANELAVGQRMQRQSNLFLTPRMLLDTYRQNRGDFVHGAAAELTLIRFTGREARNHAEQARTLWKDDLTAAAVLALIPGATATITPQLGPIDDQSRKGLDDQLVDFAIAGPQGQISPPLTIGDGIVVARIVHYQPQRHGKFEDPEVQLALREIASRKVVTEFAEQALERARDRTEVWKNPAFR